MRQDSSVSKVSGPGWTMGIPETLRELTTRPRNRDRCWEPNEKTILL